jgi:FHA domain-containing protein
VITLTVISYNGASGDSGLSAHFDELGGTIGRADTNQLVLPDPDRAISRVHAQLVFRNGGFAIIDRGSNPILVNGQAIGNGQERRIQTGDQIQIGGYVLGVKAGPAGAPAASASDPFADLLGPASFGSAAGASAPAALLDPLAGFGLPAAPAAAPLPAATSPAAMGGIPDDWDPFAPDAPAPAAAPLFGGGNSLGLELGAAPASALMAGLGGASPDGHSLDDLFGLQSGGGNAGADPFAHSALNAPASLPNMAAHADPMASLSAAPRASAAAMQDDFSALHEPFKAPPMVVPPPAAAPAPAMPAGAVLSWDQPPTDTSHTVIVPSNRGAAPAPAATPAFSPAPPPMAVPTMMAAPARAASAPTPAAPYAEGDTAALLAAFREGLNVPELPVGPLTPEFMRLVGELLRECAAGTVDLLVARAALKREVRAEATMIVARENNPLKFSPTAEAALQHLLTPPTRGFMPAAPAMRDAFDDLRAHQFGFVAGMRSALAGVLERFDPAELEGRLTQRSGLMSLLPGSRKARMWEIFTEHYAQISSEAEDDFHSLFGKAFLEAYEEHIDQLKSGSRP